MAKTTKKTTKPVTMAERVRRIELDVNRHGANMAAITAAMREQLTSIAKEAMRASTMAHHARTNSRGNTVILNKIQNDLSLLLSGASFMQELEKAKPTEEQGLEPGDYCSGTPEELKQVADELKAMGHKMWNRIVSHRYIAWDEKDCNFVASNLTLGLHYPRPEFLSRARVTAKRLGLVPVEAKKWKPEVGSFVKFLPETWQKGEYEGVVRVNRGPDEEGHFWTAPTSEYKRGICFAAEHAEPATPEEEAKYHADQEAAATAAQAAAEAAKPIVPYVTRVMYDGEEWRVIQVVERTTHPYGLHSAKHGIDWVARDWFKVID